MPNKKSNRRRKKIGGDGNYMSSSNDNEPVNTQNVSEGHGSWINAQDNHEDNQRGIDEKAQLDPFKYLGTRGNSWDQLKVAIDKNLDVQFTLTINEAYFYGTNINKRVVKGLNKREIVTYGIPDRYYTRIEVKDVKDSTKKKLLDTNYISTSGPLKRGQFTLELIDPANPPAITQGGKTRRHKKKYRKSRKSRKNRKF